MRTSRRSLDIPSLMRTLLVSLATVPVSTQQPSPPVQGIELGVEPESAIFPLTVSQCEPVLIFYSISANTQLEILTPDGQALINFSIYGTGDVYLEWICDIPEGNSFIANGWYQQYYVVQPGSSSSCLHIRNLTATYSFASYNTPVFQSYTQNPSNTTSPSLDTAYLASLTVSYPTEPYSTIAVDEDHSLTATVSFSSVSQDHTLTATVSFSSVWGSVAIISSTAPSQPTSFAHKSKTATIAGSVVGAIATILLTLLIFLCCMRNRRKSRIEANDNPSVDPFRLMTAIPHPSDTESPPAASMPSASRSAAGLLTHITRTVTSNFTDGPSSNPQTLPSHKSQHSLRTPIATENAESSLRPDAVQQGPAIPGATSSSVAPVPQTSPVTALGNEPQNDRSNMVTALNAFVQLDPTERQTLVSALHVMTLPTSTGSTPGNTDGLPPPPYDG